MPNKDSKIEDSKDSTISFQIKKEKINNYTESYENTLNNIFALTAFTVKQYGRSGYPIKILEQILAELKKLNGKK